MKKLIGVAAASVMAALTIAPMAAAQDKKTEMFDEGKAVDSLLLRYGFEGTWVVDPQTILLRDTYRDHYVVTIGDRCDWLELDRAFYFFPKLTDRVLAARVYEVRDDAHKLCTISKIEKVSRDVAQGLRVRLAAKS